MKKNMPINLITTIIGTALPFLMERRKTVKEGTVEIIEDPKLSTGRITQFGGSGTLITLGLSYIESDFKIAAFLIIAGIFMAIGMEVAKRINAKE
jgi:hypothetical protein